MAFTVLTFLFMLEASALEVPHWVQQKSPSFNSAPVFQELMAPFRSLQSKMQTPNSRRLQAIMSDECNAACPTVKAYLAAATAPADDSLSKEEEEAAQAKMMCDNTDALACMASEKACQEPKKEGEKEDTAEETKKSMDMFKCSCTCTSELKMMDDTKKMCANKATVLKCLTDNSVCGGYVKVLGGTRVADITCETLDLKCEELGGKLETCVGAEKWTTFQDACGKAAEDLKLADHKDKCCPLLSEVMGCYNKKCVTLGWETQELMVANMDAGPEKTEAMKGVKGNYQWGSVCTDAALPASKDALMNQGGAAAAADDASHAVPVLGMVAMLIAASF
jgi:hypothetical protein